MTFERIERSLNGHEYACPMASPCVEELSIRSIERFGPSRGEFYSYDTHVNMSISWSDDGHESHLQSSDRPRSPQRPSPCMRRTVTCTSRHGRKDPAMKRAQRLAQWRSEPILDGRITRHEQRCSARRGRPEHEIAARSRPRDAATRLRVPQRSHDPAAPRQRACRAAAARQTAAATIRPQTCRILWSYGEIRQSESAEGGRWVLSRRGAHLRSIHEP